MIAIDNSLAGRVADVHHLMPESGLHIVGEHFQRVVHHLLAPKGATLADAQGRAQPRPRPAAMPQADPRARPQGGRACRYRRCGRRRGQAGDPTQAAIASELAGQIYGLVSLRADIEDDDHNTTRFVIMQREPFDPDPSAGLVLTSFVFRVRSVPAALYKALGGFATNGVNIVKLESYMIDGWFTVAQFYAEIEGHPDQRSVRLAIEELRFFSREVKILGVYPANPFRQGGGR